MTMDPSTDVANAEIEELLQLCPELQQAEEAGVTFYFLPRLAMPAGTTPARVDALLCPTPRDGYESRLYLAERVSGGKQPLNWNGNIRLLERNWFAVSYRTPQGLRPAQMVVVHLGAFR
jgi:hypothetical protein